MLLATNLPTADATLPSNEEVREVLRQRIDVEGRGVGIVVGLIEGRRERWVYNGGVSPGGPGVGPRTTFVIGSVTKVFTDLLLADMVRKGEVKLDDPVAAYLPADVKVPAHGGRQITLLDLATHRSGLPRMPANFHPADPANPYADYTPEQMYEFLSGYELTRDIGSKMEYSNLGVGLLGHALARRAGKSYEDLVVERICQPLAMIDTRITLSASMRNDLAKGYDEKLAPVKNWDIATLSGTGALRSNMRDMLEFVEAELDVVTSPLAPGNVPRAAGTLIGLPATPLTLAMQDTQIVRNGTNSPKTDIGLGWFIDRTYDPPIWWHNGATGGYRAFVAFRPATKTGVVVLSNTALDIDDIGQHLLDSRYPLTTLKTHTVVPIKPELADRYVGRYQLAPNFILTFSREGDHDFIVAADQPRDEVFPESETDFFSKSFDGQVTFTHDADGKWDAMILHQGGIPDQTAKRLP